MKKKKLRDIPDEVWFLAGAKHFGYPVGSEFYYKTVNNNPDHFPEEYTAIKKWEAVPQEAKDAYWEEYLKLDKELHADEPEGGSGGIFEQMNNTERAQKWNKWYNEVYWPKHEVMEKKLHKKHYGKYGY